MSGIATFAAIRWPSRVDNFPPPHKRYFAPERGTPDERTGRQPGRRLRRGKTDPGHREPDRKRESA
ncbi:hypothetical protein DZC41_16305, partial [Acinetobacter haemolyticus]|nr:hypothetical protein [Acinetobacter haemolyticus]